MGTGSRTYTTGTIPIQGSWWCNFQQVLESKGPRTKSFNVQGQKTDVPAQEERANSFFLHFFCSTWPSTDCLVPTHIGEGRVSVCWFSAHPFQKDPHRHIQKCFTSYLSITWPCQLTHKINHHAISKTLIWSQVQIPFAYKVTHPPVLRIRTWTCMEAIIQPTTLSHLRNTTNASY